MTTSLNNTPLPAVPLRESDASFLLPPDTWRDRSLWRFSHFALHVRAQHCACGVTSQTSELYRTFTRRVPPVGLASDADTATRKIPVVATSATDAELAFHPELRVDLVTLPARHTALCATCCAASRPGTLRLRSTSDAIFAAAALALRLAQAAPPRAASPRSATAAKPRASDSDVISF